MRIGTFLLTGVLLIAGFVLSLTWVGEPDVTTLRPVSVRVSSVPPKSNRPSGGGGVYVGGSRGSGRYSSGGGFSAGK